MLRPFYLPERKSYACGMAIKGGCRDRWRRGQGAVVAEGEPDKGERSRAKRQRKGIQHPITAAANQFLQDVLLEKLKMGAKNSKRKKGGTDGKGKSRWLYGRVVINRRILTDSTCRRD